MQAGKDFVQGASLLMLLEELVRVQPLLPQKIIPDFGSCSPSWSRLAVFVLTALSVTPANLYSQANS